MSGADSTFSSVMRLVVARCEVLYTGRLTARLPEAVRLLMFKADGSFLVHDDAGGFRPLNWIRSVFQPESSANGI
jgi:RecB family endonuclease NucS